MEFLTGKRFLIKKGFADLRIGIHFKSILWLSLFKFVFWLKKKNTIIVVTKYHVDKKKNYVTHPKWPGCKIINYLRWCIEKISQERNCLENLMRNNFNIAMPQASQKIKD